MCCLNPGRAPGHEEWPGSWRRGWQQGGPSEVGPGAEAALRAARAAGRPLLCVDLGSMPMMGFVPDAASFARALADALHAARMHGLLLAGAAASRRLTVQQLPGARLERNFERDAVPVAPAPTPFCLGTLSMLRKLCAAIGHGNDALGGSNRHVHHLSELCARAEVMSSAGDFEPLLAACAPGALPERVAGSLAAVRREAHAPLLQRCAGILHHGGAGTTAAALRAATPQLVCPLHFDQFSWVQPAPLPFPGPGMQKSMQFRLLHDTSCGALCYFTFVRICCVRRWSVPAQVFHGAFSARICTSSMLAASPMFAWTARLDAGVAEAV